MAQIELQMAGSVEEAAHIASGIGFPVVVRSIGENGGPVIDRYVAYDKGQLREIAFDTLQASPKQQITVRPWAHPQQ